MLLLTCGLSLFGDPREVVRASVDDRSCGHTGHLIGMLALSAGNDLGYPLTSGVQRYPALDPLVYLTLPSVDRPHGGEVVRTGGQVVLDQIRTVDRVRLVKRLGRIDGRTATSVLDVLREMFEP